MRIGRTVRGALASLAPLIVVGALALGAVPSGHDGPREIRDWSQDQIAFVGHGPRALSSGDAPQPPSSFELIETSPDGSILGHEISSLVDHLSRTIDEESASGGSETAETIHEVICFAISSLLEHGIEPDDPLEMTRTINAYLLGSELPPIEYFRARGELEKIYVVLKRASSSDKLAREVADALCDQAV
jgi:hypothetical protein